MSVVPLYVGLDFVTTKFGISEKTGTEVGDKSGEGGTGKETDFSARESQKDKTPTIKIKKNKTKRRY